MTLDDTHRPITPEPIHLDVPGYTDRRWDYPARCADLELALHATRERIEEWDEHADPHGWWHERPHLIALYNAAVANL